MVVHLVKGRGAVLVDPEHGGSPQPLRPQAGADADGASGTRLLASAVQCLPRWQHVRGRLLAITIPFSEFAGLRLPAH